MDVDVLAHPDLAHFSGDALEGIGGDIRAAGLEERPVQEIQAGGDGRRGGAAEAAVALDDMDAAMLVEHELHDDRPPELQRLEDTRSLRLDRGIAERRRHLRLAIGDLVARAQHEALDAPRAVEPGVDAHLAAFHIRLIDRMLELPRVLESRFAVQAQSDLPRPRAEALLDHIRTVPHLVRALAGGNERKAVAFA